MILVGDNEVCSLPLVYDDAFQNGRCPQHCRELGDDGSLCSLPSMPNGYCYRHGEQEQTAVQVMSEGGTSDARAKLLTGRQASIYETAVNDPDILGHRKDLGLLEVRIQELIAETKEWKSEELLNAILKEIGRASKKMIKALDKVKEGKEKARGLVDLEELILLSELHTLINHSLQSYSTWTEIEKMLQRRKLIADSERKRLVDQQKFITGERAMSAISDIQVALKESVNMHVDRETASLIMSEFSSRVRERIGFQ